MSRRDVVVVGGGPAGAATAIGLARRGVDVLVLDRARFPRDKPCGEFLSPAGVPLLEALGAAGAVEAAGARRLDRVRIVVHGEPVDLAFPDGDDGPAWGYALSRRRLDAALLETARSAGAEVSEGALVEAPLTAGDGVRGVAVRDADGGARREIAARVVVGAGGRNDPVARALGLQRRGSRRRYDLLAHWEPAGDPGEAEDVCELRVIGDRYVAAAPVEGGRTNVNGVASQAILRAHPDPGALYDAWVEADPALSRWTAGRSRGPVEASDVTPLATPTAVADGAVLVGDAALFIDPFTGQGLYLALAGASMAAGAIADALGRGRSDRAALRPYDAERKAAFDAKRKTSAALQRVLFRRRLSRRIAAALASDRDLSEAVAAVTGDLSPAERIWSLPWAIRLAARALAPGGRP